MLIITTNYPSVLAGMTKDDNLIRYKDECIETKMTLTQTYSGWTVNCLELTITYKGINDKSFKQEINSQGDQVEFINKYFNIGKVRRV